MVCVATFVVIGMYIPIMRWHLRVSPDDLGISLQSGQASVLSERSEVHIEASLEFLKRKQRLPALGTYVLLDRISIRRSLDMLLGCRNYS